MDNVDVTTLGDPADTTTDASNTSSVSISMSMHGRAFACMLDLYFMCCSSCCCSCCRYSRFQMGTPWGIRPVSRARWRPSPFRLSTSPRSEPGHAAGLHMLLTGPHPPSLHLHTRISRPLSHLISPHPPHPRCFAQSHACAHASSPPPSSPPRAHDRQSTLPSPAVAWPLPRSRQHRHFPSSTMSQQRT